LDIEYIISNSVIDKKTDKHVLRIAKRLNIPPSFPENAAAVQEYFIVEGISLGIANPTAASPVLGPGKDQIIIADNIGGIIYRRPIGRPVPDTTVTRRIEFEKDNAPPPPTSNWVMICPDCPIGNVSPAAAPAANKDTKTGTASLIKLSPENEDDKPKDTISLTYNIEHPCSAVMANAMQQINFELAKRGLWADPTPKTKAIQIFIR
jgi:hypothetical protein